MRLNIINTNLPALMLVLVFGWIPVRAQYDIATYDDIKDEYPENNIIILKKHTYLNIGIRNNEPDIELKNEERILYLKNAKGMDPNHATYTSAFNELTAYEANSYVLENDKYRKIPVKEYKEVKKFDGGVFFDDQTQLIFTFPGVSEGSVIELNTTHKLHEPRFLGIYFLNEYFPVHEFRLIAEVDPGIELDFIQFNIPEGGLEISETVKRGRKIYTLSLEKLPNIKFEDNQPDRRYFTPHVIPVIRSYESQGKVHALLSDNDALYKWYSGFVKDIDKDIDHSGLREIVDEVTTREMTEEDKVRAIYYWVQKNIKYIAFEDGMGGFIPRKPDEVLAKRYGDCKDKTSILHALLKEAGIPSYYTWVGSRDIPYSYSQICSPAVDNHMILTYIRDNDYYFLDGTGSYQRMDLPTAFIQGKEVLIGIDEDRFEIRKVPVIPSERNLISDSLILRTEGRNLLGTGHLEIGGLPKIRIQYRLDTEDSKSQKERLEGIVEKGNNKFVLTDYTLGAHKRFDEELAVDYTFTLDDYIQKAGDELYLNMNLEKFWLGYKIKEDRTNPVEFESALRFENTYVLELPENSKVTYIPENQAFDHTDFTFEITYEQVENQLIYHHNVSVDRLLLDSQEDFTAWRSFIAALESAYKETIVISVPNEN